MGRNRNNRSEGGGGSGGGSGGGGRGRGGRGRRGRGRGGRGRGGRGRDYRNRPNEADLPDSGTGLVEPGYGLLELHPNGYGFCVVPAIIILGNVPIRLFPVHSLTNIHYVKEC